MSAYALRCRVCEEVTVAEPLDACRRCDGPNDVLYDWAWVEHAVTRISQEPLKVLVIYSPPLSSHPA